MTGWKTKAGAALLAVGAFISATWPEFTDLAKAIEGVGVAVMGIGIAHKIEKSAP